MSTKKFFYKDLKVGDLYPYDFYKKFSLVIKVEFNCFISYEQYYPHCATIYEDGMIIRVPFYNERQCSKQLIISDGQIIEKDT